MRIEWVILFIVWIISIGLIFAIPRHKFRLAIVAFLFKQVITWIVGLYVVELGFITYPVRMFASVNRSSFCYEYFFYPMACSIFNAYYPTNKGVIYKFSYYFTFCTVLTIPEVLFEKYTDLIEYKEWTWYLTWGTLFLTFLLSRKFCVWYFRKLDQVV